MERTGKPLSVELGPGLLSTIFDGIQRPLKQIAINSGDVFIPRGVDVPALDRKKAYEFKPSKVKVSCLRKPMPAMRMLLLPACQLLLPLQDEMYPPTYIKHSMHSKCMASRS